MKVTCIIALIIISASSFASAWKKINKVESRIILPSRKVRQATAEIIYDVFCFCQMFLLSLVKYICQF